LITMDDASEVFPTFEHPGIEFIYILEGRLEYRHGQSTYVLEPGDALTFSGDIPHGPEKLLQLPIRFLAIIHYPTAVA
jgi:quercetin dioxygenase-like cupin family protein